jgi:hypothetical protein
MARLMGQSWNGYKRRTSALRRCSVPEEDPLHGLESARLAKPAVTDYMGRMTDLPPDPAAPINRRTGTVPPRRSDPLTRFFGGSPLWVLAKLAMLSVVIGLVLAVFGLDVQGILYALQELFYSFFDNIYDAFHAVWRWFALGAVIVFPLWLLSRVLNLGGRRR